jgi:hypothetical protein
MEILEIPSPFLISHFITLFSENTDWMILELQYFSRYVGRLVCNVFLKIFNIFSLSPSLCFSVCVYVCVYMCVSVCVQHSTKGLCYTRVTSITQVFL